MNHLSDQTPRAAAPVLTPRVSQHLLACVMAFALLPSSARAQAPASTFDELRLVVRDGNEVIVTDSNGRHTRGRVEAVTTSSLDLVVQRRRFLILLKRSHESFADMSVTSVTRIDSIKEGAILGFLAGYVPVALGACNNGDALSCDLGLVFVGPVAGATGAGIGILIDGMINRIVYRGGAGSPPVAVALSPLLSPKAAGASVRFSF